MLGVIEQFKNMGVTYSGTLSQVISRNLTEIRFHIPVSPHFQERGPGTKEL